MPEIVFDSCCLSNFALSDSLFILKNLYGSSAYITDFVSTEILRGIQQGHKDLTKIQDSIKEGWLGEISLRTKGEKALYETLSVSLGFGEASSIAIAKTKGFRFASDDKTARREASHLDIQVTGTLGILKKAVLNTILEPEKGDIILAKMTAQGFYSPINSLREIKT
jgi:predicted nucleic acid-binding protein